MKIDNLSPREASRGYEYILFPFAFLLFTSLSFVLYPLYFILYPCYNSRAFLGSLSIRISTGFSRASLTATRNPTDSRPSIIRWSYDKATYIVERPVAINGKVEIRPIMYVALSYDHRIIDGRESVGFLVAVKEALEKPVEILMDNNPQKALEL